MSLNIKNAEADGLVEQLSKLTGESKTRAVIVALRERLNREERARSRKARSAELLEIGRRCANLGHRDTLDHAEMLYDERGLPR